MGHETRKRGATSSGANPPVIVAFLQKGGQFLPLWTPPPPPPTLARLQEPP